MRSYEQEKSNTLRFKTITLPAIAEALGSTVTPGTEADWCGHIGICGDSGQSLFFSYDSHKDRITVSGDYPKSRLPGETNREFYPRDCLYPTPETPSISVDATRAPDKIVADIRRRLLPTYQDLFAKCAARRDENEAYVRGINGFAATLAGSFGTKAKGEPFKSSPLLQYVELPKGLGYSPAEVRRDTVAFKLDVSHEQALKLAQFLKTL